MPKNKTLSRAQIRTALADLNRLSNAEYGVSLEQLLTEKRRDSALRMQRLTGIVLKRPFAKKSPPTKHSATGARRSWPWKKRAPETSTAIAPKELALLNELRMPGPWNERKKRTGTAKDKIPVSWGEFQSDVEHERGLFKVLALYVNDKIRGQSPKTLREYLKADESRRFEAGLDLANLVFDFAVTAPLATLLGIPSLAVGVALVGVQFGYRRMTDSNTDRVGDSRS